MVGNPRFFPLLLTLNITNAYIGTRDANMGWRGEKATFPSKSENTIGPSYSQVWVEILIFFFWHHTFTNCFL